MACEQRVRRTYFIRLHGTHHAHSLMASRTGEGELEDQILSRVARVVDFQLIECLVPGAERGRRGAGWGYRGGGAQYERDAIRRGARKRIDVVDVELRVELHGRCVHVVRRDDD